MKSFVRPVIGRMFVLSLSLVLLAGACSSTDSASSAVAGTTQASAAGTTQASAAVQQKEEPKYERIISLSPTATEMVFAIGAGEQMVAADQFSDYPAEAPTTELSGFNLNAEAVLSYLPDLILTSSPPGSEQYKVFENQGIKVLYLTAAEDFEDIYRQIALLGETIGFTDNAENLISDMRESLSELVAEVPPRAEPLTYFYELDPSFYSVTDDTFIGTVLEMAGLKSIAPAGTEAGSYPQISAEEILNSDPDLIILADTVCCSQTAEAVRQRAGWEGLQAVRKNQIVELDDSVASRWGPRIIILFEKIIESTKDIS